MQGVGYDTLADEGGRVVRGPWYIRHKYPLIALVIVTISLAIISAVVVSARMNSPSKAWSAKIQTSNVMAHLQSLQDIATANNNNRASTTSGYAASVAFVVDTLTQNTNYDVAIQEFPYETFVISYATNATLDFGTNNFTLVYNTGFLVMGSANGTITIDKQQITTASNYGCNTTDYAESSFLKVLVIKRGLCAFIDKINAAMTANPIAIIIYNEGDTADRIGLFGGNIGATPVPVLAIGYFVGATLLENPSSTVTFEVSGDTNFAYTKNVIAQTKVGRTDRVIVVGSHLDSVPAGPGINDNGSGSSLNLELALLLSADSYQKQIVNQIRFCWWGAEELGLLGSNFYVKNLNETNPEALANISANLNFDMIGSPNFYRAVYNGTSDPKSIGSGVIQRDFNAFFASQNLAVVPTAFDGRSDYGPFLAAGIPAGGLFTGAEAVKTDAGRALFGGLAGASYDPCYHQACDTIDNINQVVVGEMSQAAAEILETLATQEDLYKYLNTP